MPTENGSLNESEACTPILINDWRAAALRLYYRVGGKRCVKCSKPVDIPVDGVLYEMYGEFMLLHQDCSE